VSSEGSSTQGEISGEVWLYRLVKVTNCDFIDGEWHFQSSAFSNNSNRPGNENEMSVVLGDTLQQLEREPEDLPEVTFPEAPKLWGVAKLRVDCVRGVPGQEVVRSPKEKEPAHGDVLGEKKAKRRRKLKACAAWVVKPAAPN
jgi:hypothetical protein